MSIFVDTSAFLIMFDEDDPEHNRAVQIWNDLLDKDDALISTSYVVVETISLVQRRFGVATVRIFQDKIVPVLTIEWIGQQTHADALRAVLVANRRDLSLVDCVSFTVMRNLGISSAFVFDGHFDEQGFVCIH